MSERVNDTPNSISIGPNVKFKGSIYTLGSAVIQGEVLGKIEAQNLVVGKTGHVSGDVTANEINVYGELHKDVTCVDRMVIHATGSVKGNLLYNALEILRGGSFEGSLVQEGE